MTLTMGLVMRLIAFAKSAWKFDCVVSRSRDGWLWTKSTFELSAGEHVFMAVHEYSQVSVYIDDQRVGGLYHSVGLTLRDWFMWPSQRTQRRLGRHLLRLFRSDIQNAVSIFRAEERLRAHQWQVKAQEEELEQQKQIIATVTAAEQSLASA